MRAFTVERYGDMAGVRVGDVPDPDVGANDVLVRVRAAGINPLDRMIREGEMKAILPYELPFVLGNDLAGVVVDVGAAVTRFAVGDEVFARPDKDRIGNNWDPRVVDGLAARRRVIAFDNRGVGGSSGSTPDTVEAMARDAVRFIRALGLDRVDLLGLSLGGFIAQVIAEEEPSLVRKVILAGTGLAGGPGIDKVPALTIKATLKGVLTRQDPKLSLFFNDTADGRKAGLAFLERLKERTRDRDKDISLPSSAPNSKPSDDGAARLPRTCRPSANRFSWPTARVTGWCPARTHSTWPHACPGANSSSLPRCRARRNLPAPRGIRDQGARVPRSLSSRTRGTGVGPCHGVARPALGLWS